MGPERMIDPSDQFGDFALQNLPSKHYDYPQKYPHSAGYFSRPGRMLAHCAINLSTNRIVIFLLFGYK